MDDLKTAQTASNSQPQGTTEGTANDAKKGSKWYIVAIILGIILPIFSFYAGYLRSMLPEVSNMLPGLSLIFDLTGRLILIYGLSRYAQRKGRNWKWGFMGILGFIGFIIVYFLKDLASQQRVENVKQTNQDIQNNPPFNPVPQSPKYAIIIFILLGVAFQVVVGFLVGIGFNFYVLTGGPNDKMIPCNGNPANRVELGGYENFMELPAEFTTKGGELFVTARNKHWTGIFGNVGKRVYGKLYIGPSEKLPILNYEKYGEPRGVNNAIITIDAWDDGYTKEFLAPGNYWIDGKDFDNIAIVSCASGNLSNFSSLNQWKDVTFNSASLKIPPEYYSGYLGSNSLVAIDSRPIVQTSSIIDYTPAFTLELIKNKTLDQIKQELYPKNWNSQLFQFQLIRDLVVYMSKLGIKAPDGKYKTFTTIFLPGYSHYRSGIVAETTIFAKDGGYTHRQLDFYIPSSIEKQNSNEYEENIYHLSSIDINISTNTQQKYFDIIRRTLHVSDSL